MDFSPFAAPETVILTTSNANSHEYFNLYSYALYADVAI